MWEEHNHTEWLSELSAMFLPSLIRNDPGNQESLGILDFLVSPLLESLSGPGPLIRIVYFLILVTYLVSSVTSRNQHNVWVSLQPESLIIHSVDGGIELAHLRHTLKTCGELRPLRPESLAVAALNERKDVPREHRARSARCRRSRKRGSRCCRGRERRRPISWGRCRHRRRRPGRLRGSGKAIRAFSFIRVNQLFKVSGTLHL